MKVCKFCGSGSLRTLTDGTSECLYCGTLNKFEVIPQTTFVPIDCNHNVDVKFLNGEYISVCTICGKILDRKKVF